MNLNPFMMVYNVDVYMKSGNVIHLRRHTQFTVKKNGSDVTSITHGTTTASSKILQLNVDQVEAVIQVGWRIALRWWPRIS